MTWFGRRSADESGVALVLAMGVAVILLIAGAAVTTSVVSDVSIVGGHVLAVTASEAATAGMNETLGAVEADLSSTQPLPCTTSGQIGVATQEAASETYSATLTYYSALSGSTPSGELSSCSSTPSGSGSSGYVAPGTEVAAVAVTVTGTAGAANAQPSGGISAVLYDLSSVNAVFAGGYGIDDGSGVEFVNAMTTNSTLGSVYIDGPVTCSNNAEIDGNLFADGATTLTNACTITGWLDANGDVSVSNAPTVDGDVEANGSVSFGNSNASPQFQGSLTAAGTVTDTTGKSTSTNVAGTILASTPVTLPSAPAFPEVSWDPSAWEAAGYSVETFTPSSPSSDCGSYSGIESDGSVPAADTSGVYTDLFDASDAQGPTVLYTDCPINLYGGTVVQLNANFVLVDTASVQMSNDTTFESSSAATENFFLIQPWSSGMTCSSANDIQASNAVTFGTASNPLHTLLYTPCSFLSSNTVTLTGQIVAGSLGSSLDNSVVFTSVPFHIVPGTVNDSPNLVPVTQYTEPLP